jgi:uncharacterized protein (TIGR02145 family)
MKKYITLLLLHVALFSNGQLSFFNGNNNYFVKPVVPNLGAITDPPTLITPYSANSGGNVTNDGGVITEKGMVWSTSTNPTIALPTKRIAGYGKGSFVCNMNGLTPATTYYARSYATNSAGTVYGSEIRFTTAALTASYILTTVNVGNQVWTDKNLDVTTYRNGDAIPYAAKSADWLAYNNSQTGAYTYFLFTNSNTGTIYGKLYNWYAINDSRGLAPTGYHVPTTAEWTTLLSSQPRDGFTLRSNTTDWGAEFSKLGTNLIINRRSTTYIGDNSSGFNALPGGAIFPNAANVMGGSAGFWHADVPPPNSSDVNWTYFAGNAIYYGSALGLPQKGFALSVRLIKD